MMRAQSTTTGYRYYRCATRIEHRAECGQRQVPADEIEDQVVGLLRDLRLPPDWRGQLLAQPSPPQELARRDAELARLKARLERVRELYLAGEIDRERFAQEQRDGKQRIADLADVSHSVLLSIAQMLEMPDEQWAGLTRLKQKSLVQLALARATLVRDQLRAVRPSCAAYPLIRLALDGGNGSKLCHSGSDGSYSPGYVADDGIETLPPGLPLPDPDRTGIEQGPAAQVV